MINLCCAFGGRSAEYEVSLESAYSVITNVDLQKYNVIKLGVTRNGRWYVYEGENEKIKDGSWEKDTKHLIGCHFSQNYQDPFLYTDKGKMPIDVFFPVMHGENCEDGILQGALSLCGIPFVGSGCAAAAAAMDKDFTNRLSRPSVYRQAARCACVAVRLRMICTRWSIGFWARSPFRFLSSRLTPVPVSGLPRSSKKKS